MDMGPSVEGGIDLCWSKCVGKCPLDQYFRFLSQLKMEILQIMINHFKMIFNPSRNAFSSISDKSDTHFMITECALSGALNHILHRNNHFAKLTFL